MARAGFGSYQSYTLQRKRRLFLLRTLRVVLTVYLAYLVLDGLFFKTYTVATAGMTPNIAEGDHVLALPLVYEPRLPFVPWPLPSLRAPVRGDVVIVQPPFMEDEFPPVRFLEDLLRFVTFGAVNPFQDSDPSKRLTVKRLVAVPGDTLSFKAGIAYIKKLGEEFALSEFETSEKLYDVLRNTLPEGWEATDPLSGESVEITLGEDEYWVLSDNRSSEDSSVWGPVRRKHLKALVWLTYWPFQRFRLH